MSVFDDMIDAIRELGWGKHTLLNGDDGRVCLVGAWGVATHKSFQHDWGYIHGAFSRSTEGALIRDVICELTAGEFPCELSPSYLAFIFNDEVAKSADDVIAVIEKARGRSAGAYHPGHSGESVGEQ